MRDHLRARGITDLRVLEAMKSIPREKFVDRDMQAVAYTDNPLPIAAEQTISQPYIVALMCEALLLQGAEKVLEIGTGSGYAAAVLSLLCKQVYTIETISSLAESANRMLSELNYKNINVICADGTLGWPEAAPFDAIVVTAGGPDVPESLKQQLAVGGRLVIPAGKSHFQQSLLRVTRTAENKYKTEDLGAVRFVPLVGCEGWAETQL